MSHILTLIANPARPAVDAALVDRVARATGASDQRWLAEGVAADLSCETEPTGLEEIIGKAPVDWVMQPATQASARRKKILLADMDSTMIGQECIDELADEMGLKDRIAGVTARAMNGEIAFDAALRERVALLKGMPTDMIDRVIETRITPAPGGKQLVATMRKNGAWCALISGGFTDFTSRVATMLGFDEHRANRLEHANGKLTGSVVEPILGREAKAAALRDIAAQHSLTPNDVIAVGDGANDLGMLTIAGMGVAVHAKPAVAAQARMRIDHGDLTALLYVQGYSADEIVR